MSDVYQYPGNSRGGSGFIKEKQSLAIGHNFGHACSSRQLSSRQDELFPCRHPHSSENAEYRKRIHTFLKGWPNRIKATPRQIAEAGFYFISCHDRVKCFYCDGGLQNWSYGDDPWFEHAKWYPDCEFLLKQKGLDYVDKVGSQFPNIKRPRKITRLQQQDQQVQQLRSSTRSDSTRTTNPQIASDTLTKLPQVAIERAMQSRIVKETLKFGFDESLVKDVVSEKLNSGSGEFDSVCELLDSIHAFENENDDIYTSSIDDNISSPKTCEYQLEGSQKIALKRNPLINEDDTKKIEKKLNELENERTCKICLDTEVNCVLVGCGHVCCCLNCAGGITTCPICRSKIEKIFKFYRKRN